MSRISKLEKKITAALLIMGVTPVLLLFFRSAAGGSFPLSGYLRLMVLSPDYMRGFWNSVIYTGVIMLISIPVSTLAAYGITMFRLRGRQVIWWLWLLLLLMPFSGVAASQYLLLKAMGILNTPAAVILPNAFCSFSAILMTKYMSGVGRNIILSAKAEGLKDVDLLRYIVFPLTVPGLKATAVLCFINFWSLTEQPYMFIDNERLFPLAVSLNYMGNTNGTLYSGAVVFAVIPIVLYAAVYKDIYSGESSYVRRAGNRKGLRVISVFLAVMLLFSYISFKTEDALTARVSVYHASRGRSAVSSDYALPDPCIRQDGDDFCVFTVITDRNNGKDNILLRYTVEKKSSEDGFSVVSGGFPADSMIVCFSSTDLAEGDRVYVLTEAYTK